MEGAAEGSAEMVDPAEAGKKRGLSMMAPPVPAVTTLGRGALGALELDRTRRPRRTRPTLTRCAVLVATNTIV